MDPHTATGDTTSISFGGGGGGFAPGGEGAETAAEGAGDNFFFNYTRNKLALADVIFQVEWSDTMAANDWQSTGVTEEIINDDGSEQQIKATVPCGTAGRRFVRLKITRP